MAKITIDLPEIGEHRVILIEVLPVYKDAQDAGHWAALRLRLFGNDDKTVILDAHDTAKEAVKRATKAEALADTIEWLEQEETAAFVAALDCLTTN